MGNRWGPGSPEKRIEAFIGAWGIKTSSIETAEELRFLASRLFEIDLLDAAEMATSIDALGRKKRKFLANRNLDRVFGDGGQSLNAQHGVAENAGEISQHSLARMMDNSAPQMIDGEPFNCAGEMDIDPAKLLRKVVVAVINAGRADILWEYPDVLAFFGARIPERSEVEHLHGVDERMFEAAERWPNRKGGPIA